MSETAQVELRSGRVYAPAAQADGVERGGNGGVVRGTKICVAHFAKVKVRHPPAPAAHVDAPAID